MSKPVAVLDQEELTSRIRKVLAESHPKANVTKVTPLTGGRSSLTYLVEVEGMPTDALVAKVAPPGFEPVRNRDVLRQARIQEFLSDIPGVEVPRVVASDLGTPPEIPPFFLMHHAEGGSAEPILTPAESMPWNAQQLQSLAPQAVEMLAKLHGSPAPEGETPMSLLDEVDKWARVFATVPEEIRGDADKCHQRLLESVPAALEPAVLHGDYRFGNFLCTTERVTSVIDWEIWSVGDPRIDLAWFMLMVDEKHPKTKNTTSGVPGPSALLADYEKVTGIEVVDYPWFAALVRYKQAAADSLISKNKRKRGIELTDVDFAFPTKMLAWAVDILDSAEQETGR
jgi:aminoglycoside phosphotransferase (APT) family kinase protein